MISLNCHMDLSKLLFGFVKVVTWICLWKLFCISCPLPDQAEVWPWFQSLLKLLLWTKGVEWLKVLNAQWGIETMYDIYELSVKYIKLQSKFWWRKKEVDLQGGSNGGWNSCLLFPDSCSLFLSCSHHRNWTNKERLTGGLHNNQ